MEHAKEPWKVTTWADGSMGIYDSNNVRLAVLDYDDEANARRIVACINAFEGYDLRQVELIAHNGGVTTFSYETVKAMEADRDRWKALAVEAGRELGSYHGNGNCVVRLKGNVCQTCNILDKLQEAQNEQ